MRINSYTKTGLISWGSMGIATLAPLVAIGTGAPAVVFGLAALGLIPSIPFVRKRRLIESHLEQHRLAEQMEQKLIEVTTRYNPQKTVMERAYAQKGLETRILNVFNSAEHITLSSCVEAATQYPTFRRYLCEIYAQKPDNQLYTDYLIESIRREMQLPANTDGSLPGIIVHPQIPGTNKFALDIERTDLDPVKDHLPTLKKFIPNAPPLSLEVLIGYDFEQNRLVTKRVEEDDITHVIASGATRSGKSVWLQSFVNWLVANYDERQVNLILADLKNNDITAGSPTFGTNYDNLPHMKLPVVTSAEGVIIALHGLYQLMNLRNKQLAALASLPIDDPQRIDEASVKALHRKYPTSMPHTFFCIEEAQYLKVANYDANPDSKTLWQVLAEEIMRLGASAGIHLVLAYQRSTWSEVSLTMSSNASIKIALKTNDAYSGAIALGVPINDGTSEAGIVGRRCQNLAGRGDMLFREAGGSIRRLQALYSANRPADFNIQMRSSTPVYLGDDENTQGIFKSVKSIAAQFGKSKKIDFPVVGLLESESQEEKVAVVTPAPAVPVKDETHKVYQLFLEYRDSKDQSERNFTEFAKSIPNVANDRRNELAEKAIRTYFRQTALDSVLGLLTQPGASEVSSEELMASELIDWIYGTKGSSHASRIKHGRHSAKESDRLSWALDIVRDAMKLAGVSNEG